MHQRQPFWIPPAQFYALAVMSAAAFSFFIWEIFPEGKEDMSLLPAGIAASIILAAAVILREMVLPKKRNRLFLAQGRLDYNLKGIQPQKPNLRDENKLTLEKNAATLKEITQKSEAANVLGRFSEVHLEIFELCEEYLQRTTKELETVGVGSPRTAALRQGREKVRKLHKIHLLAWSSASSRSLMREAKASVTISKKLELAARALKILDSAIGFYPNERQLVDSAKVVREFTATVKVTHWIEQAKRCIYKENYKRAIKHYRDALIYLECENGRSDEQDAIIEKIKCEIENLTKISDEKQELSLPQNQ
jgi:hypothetical protein